MFGKISINGSVEWLGVPDFHRTGGPFWADNILDTSSSLGYGDTTTNMNWVSQHGGPDGSAFVLWNFPVCVLPVYHCRISENMRAAARRCAPRP